MASLIKPRLVRLNILEKALTPPITTHIMKPLTCTITPRVQSSSISRIKTHNAAFINKLSALNVISQDVASFSERARFFSSSVPRELSPKKEMKLQSQVSRKSPPSPPPQISKRPTPSPNSGNEYRIPYRLGPPPGRYVTTKIIVYATIGACTLITISSNLGDKSYFEKHFMLGQRNIDEGRTYTMLTSTFMHHNPLHLLCNMICLNSFASLVSPLTFIAIWIGAGYASSFLQLRYYNDKLPFDLNDKRKLRASMRMDEQLACGASGSLSGLVSMLAIRYPTMRMSLIFLPISFPAWAFTFAIMVYSVSAMKNGWQPSIGHAGHLGGAVFGCTWGFGAAMRSISRARRL